MVDQVNIAPYCIAQFLFCTSTAFVLGRSSRLNHLLGSTSRGILSNALIGSVTGIAFFLLSTTKPSVTFQKKHLKDLDFEKNGHALFSVGYLLGSLVITPIVFRIFKNTPPISFKGAFFYNTTFVVLNIVCTTTLRDNFIVGSLKPAEFVSDSDSHYAQRSDAIASAAEKINRFEAARLGVSLICRAFFKNFLCHLSVGLRNTFFTSPDRPVFKHYWRALNYLTFSIVSIPYVIAGLILPSAFKSFHRDRDDCIQMQERGFRYVLDEYKALLMKNHQINVEAILKNPGDLRNSTSWPTLKILFKSLLKTDERSSRKQYRAFVLNHRKLIPTSEKRVSKIFRAIAIVRLTPNIQAYSKIFMSKYCSRVHKHTQAKDFHLKFVGRSNDLRDKAKVMPLIDKLRRYARDGSGNLDYFMEPDIPSLRGTSSWVGSGGKTREIQYLRHATPHKQGSVIVPEYHEFLRAMEEKKEGFLFTALQRLNDKHILVNNEDARCQSLIEFEKDHPNFFLLFQSIENKLFYTPRGTFAELKEALIDSFDHPDATKANRLPKVLQGDDGYKQVMGNLFDSVHQIFFDGRVDINLEKIDYFGILNDKDKTCEWQTCIMLFFHFQREDLKFRFDDYPITTEVNPCKNNFDRGGGQNIITDRIRQHMQYELVPDWLLEATMSSVQMPPPPR